MTGYYSANTVTSSATFRYGGTACDGHRDNGTSAFTMGGGYGGTDAGQWNTWCVTSSATRSATIWGGWNTGAVSYKLSKRQQEAMEAQMQAATRAQEEYARRWKEQEKLRVEAEKVALALLVSLLSLTQRQEFEKAGHFHAVGNKTKKVYRINQGTHGNVKELDSNGKEIASYCVQPEGVPVPDANLAQKLAIECDEETFLRVANRRAVA